MAVAAGPEQLHPEEEVEALQKKIVTEDRLVWLSSLAKEVVQELEVQGWIHPHPELYYRLEFLSCRACVLLVLVACDVIKKFSMRRSCWTNRIKNVCPHFKQ